MRALRCGLALVQLGFYQGQHTSMCAAPRPTIRGCAVTRATRAKPQKATSAEELFSRKYPDCEVIRFGNFFFQAEVAHVVMLHAKAMKAGFVVNGRDKFNPWTFAP